MTITNDNRTPETEPPAQAVTFSDLTMAQAIILRTAVEDGVVYVPYYDAQFDEKQEVTSLLIQMGLLKMNDTKDVVATDAGRALLAQASQQPPAMTAAESEHEATYASLNACRNEILTRHDQLAATRDRERVLTDRGSLIEWAKTCAAQWRIFVQADDEDDKELEAFKITMNVLVSKVADYERECLAALSPAADDKRGER